LVQQLELEVLPALSTANIREMLRTVFPILLESLRLAHARKIESIHETISLISANALALSSSVQEQKGAKITFYQLIIGICFSC
jgi:hypothetical protein